ncbi:HK97-gp10 family putative phage morphogenesis protein [Pseudomonas aeruginosa]|uniref:HK97-gp10 family putative phage morphogenesis protein n=1 Tax=Pseudomonas aeruginosa TaxID=287 RepID=UPI003D7C9D8A|nr:hypothetical protein [Pseudomonas aeruginosa]
MIPKHQRKSGRTSSLKSPPSRGGVKGVVMKVGVRGGAGRNQYSKDASGNPGGDTRHWRYLEFGTKYSPAKPFMRPALSQNIEPVTEKFISELDGEIDKALRGR